VKNKVKKLKISKRVRKFADNPKVELNARKELEKDKLKRKESKTLNKVGFEYKDRKDVW
jgi:hypothetical protein|tara:strand:- start:574 stop:750 length:177 start_codon:yes stop_codon:yes gene_type:complete